LARFIEGTDCGLAMLFPKCLDDRTKVDMSLRPSETRNALGGFQYV
jgi:hypothetical protein